MKVNIDSNYSIKCPLCGSLITEFNTEDLGKTAKTFTPREFKEKGDIILGLNIKPWLLLTGHCDNCEKNGYDVDIKIQMEIR